MERGGATTDRAATVEWKRLFERYEDPGIDPAVDEALRDSGFEILVACDWVETQGSAPTWYEPLASGLSLTGFRNSRAGAFLTHQIVRTLEGLAVSPPGTTRVHDVLRLAGRALVDGGRTGIFTPMYFWLARKPA